MKEYKIYNVEFDENNDYGLMGISFVDFPAIEQNFVYFSKQQEPQLFVNAEKHEVVSPVLIPNQLILRIGENGERYYVRWPKETIEKVAKHYISEQRANNYSYMHEWFEGAEGEYEDTLLKGVYTLNMWLIEDTRNDVANKVYGYHLPEGTLMVHLKIYNRNLWKKIKSGEVKGLSIEAFISSIEAGKVAYGKNNQTKNNNEMKLTKELFEKFLLWYSQVSEDAKELADVASTDETESGEISLKYYTSDTDYIEVLTDGTVKASDGSVPQDGEYSLTDGNVIVIADGKFVETKTVEESDETEPVEAPIAEEKEDEETEETSTEDETTEEDEKPSDEEKKEEQEEEMPPYTLVEIEIAGETYQVPQQVADYIKGLEENAGMADTFRKELAKMQSRIPSVKPVGNAVKEEDVKKDSVSFSCADLIASLNKK